MTAAVEVVGLSKQFGATSVLHDIDLAIEPGEFVSLLGPSGCGKSTLLRILAGLEAQTRGSVRIAGRPVDHLPPRQRNLAMVFQNYALYPHMSVRDNVAMPLLMSRLSLLRRQPLLGRLFPGQQTVVQQIHREVAELARTLGLSDLLTRKPGQLSGGQRQRVALARAMVRQPAAFLMDEPLSNLDARLRVQVRDELADLHERVRGTFVYVTHDQTEAMSLSSRVAVMLGGRILQCAAPQVLYERPATLDVARFVGTPEINVLPLTVQQGVLRLAGDEPVMLSGSPVPHTVLDGGAAGVRPEHLAMALDGEPFAVPVDTSLPAGVHHVEHHGAEWICRLHVPRWGRPVVVRAPRRQWTHALRVGQSVRLGWSWKDLLPFDASGVLQEGQLQRPAGAPAPRPVVTR
jgi:multiple sugar transport system ATP-binding protein